MQEISDDISGGVPLELFARLLRITDSPLRTYVYLWKYAKGKKECIVYRDDIIELFNISPTIFKNHVVFLMKHDFLLFRKEKLLYDIVLKRD